ncbi:MAG: peptidase T [Clostridia bacterium]|nr:peptidase T [Clostridia bacterium]
MRADERFLKYVSYPTSSDDASTTSPSTSGQNVLADLLVEELKSFGLENARRDEYGYVYASIESNVQKDVPRIGFIAHLDTSSDAPGENIKAKRVLYEGGDLPLNEECGIYMRTSDYPYLEDYIGHHLIVTDGTTLLGADDKAGIAEIMTAIKRIIDTGAPHGKISIAFTPDEEIGRGADHFDVSGFGADYAYTVDGGALGEIEYENFNAATAVVSVNGVSIHPGSAKGKMKNATTVAFDFHALLNADEVPELTEGYEGFHHLLGMTGACEHAEMTYIIRDHDMSLFEKKKDEIKKAEASINERYGEGTVSVRITDSYFNMKEKIEPCMYVVDRAVAAMLDEGVTPVIVPIRGGTDGARLSFMGLPCPNLPTGGENFHSRFEFISVEVMDKITDIIARIITNAAGEK